MIVKDLRVADGKIVADGSPDPIVLPVSAVLSVRAKSLSSGSRLRIELCERDPVILYFPGVYGAARAAQAILMASNST